MLFLPLVAVARSRPLSCWMACAGVCSLFVLGSDVARALPVQYTATVGASVTVTVLEGFVTPLAAETVDIELTSTVTVDSVTNDLLDFSFTLVPGAVLELSAPYGGFDRVVLDAVNIFAGSSFILLNKSPAGTGYTFLASGSEVSAIYSASDSTGTNPPESGIPIGFDTSHNGAYDPTTHELNFYSVQLALLSGAGFGEPESLLVQGSFSFTGGSPTVIPEPSTAVLLGLGLGFLGARRRATSRRA